MGVMRKIKPITPKLNSLPFPFILTHMSSIFTQIIKGDIPSHKIYEDEQTFAFLDIFPPTEGRVLVVPKIEVDRFEKLSPEVYQALWESVHKVARRVAEVYADARVCVKVEGFDVPHVHVHVFPCKTPEEFYKLADHPKEPDHQTLAAVAKKLAL